MSRNPPDRDKTKASRALAVRDAGRAALAQQRERGEELLQLIRRRMTEITDGFYEIGEALAEMNNNRLYAALGHDTLADFLEAEHLLGPAQAGKLIAVATLVPREDAVRLGPEKSYAVTRYAHATGTDARALLEGKATVDGKRVTELSAVQVRAATRRVVTEKRPPGAKDQQRLHNARSLQAGLRKRGMKTAQAAAMRKAGRWVYTVVLEEADLARLLAVVR